MATDPMAPWQPTRDDPFDLGAAGHLLRRAALGASLDERRRAIENGPAATVAALFDRGDGESVESFAEAAVATDSPERLMAWRVWRLLAGRERLRERMSLFWHGHFATSIEKVRDVAMFARHLDVFDRLGLGRFDDLLLAISRDAAMIRWLDNESNVAGHPNENYAREVLELFALGRGAYTEHDVREAARAFTGWTIRDHVFHFAGRRHDRGDKSVLGRTGDLDGEDVVLLAADQPASARFIARALLATFVHPEPTDDEVDALAARYRACDRHIGETLRVLLGSRLFFSQRARRSRVKDPIDVVVGTVRSLDASASPQALADAAGDMGQRICAPPSVEGWPHDRAWLTSAAWLARANFAERLFRGESRLSPEAEGLLGDGTPQQRAARAVDLLHDGVIDDASRAALATFAASRAARGPGAASRILHAVQLLPEGQLL